MRELERETLPTHPTPRDATIVGVGRGRVGRSLASAGAAVGLDLRAVPTADAAVAAAGVDAVLLCVPDEAIAASAELVAQADPAPRLVGHTSGATTLDHLDAVPAEVARFSLHPLQTFADTATSVAGTPCAIAGSDAAAVAFAGELAVALGMRPFEVPEERRAAYHAAACIASNFLVALEQTATEVMERAGIEDGRELLAPLVLNTAANWAELGSEALTGPIARGDAATVERHREALAELAPELLPAYEALADRTAAVANDGEGVTG
jgi:predicted short-subunit dehydrogenase-like oxidoreductase (DUF2520 family)